MVQVKVSPLSIQKSYESSLDWPMDCYLQAGDRGVVFRGDATSYDTAFFEAFPRNPDTFIRGEGATIAEAEQAAWAKWRRVLTCPGRDGHEFERRGYKNGAAFCKHCDLFMSGVLPPDESCCVCGVPTYWTSDADGNFYCEDHERNKPLELWTETDWYLAYSEYSMWKFRQDNPEFEEFFEVFTKSEPSEQREGRDTGAVG